MRRSVVDSTSRFVPPVSSLRSERNGDFPDPRTETTYATTSVCLADSSTLSGSSQLDVSRPSLKTINRLRPTPALACSRALAYMW